MGMGMGKRSGRSRRSEEKGKGREGKGMKPNHVNCLRLAISCSVCTSAGSVSSNRCRESGPSPQRALGPADLSMHPGGKVSSTLVVIENGKTLLHLIGYAQWKGGIERKS
jgi:hypothetical protein